MCGNVVWNRYKECGNEEGCWIRRKGAGHNWETFLEEVILALDFVESCISEVKQVF